MESIFSYEKDPEEDYYYILGCDELSSEEQINAEYKARALLCHPDKHPNDDNATKKFAKLQQAKRVLCSEESRKKYDTWRRSGISLSYEDWCAKKDSVHTAMHWAGQAKKEAMIEGGPSTQPSFESQLPSNDEIKRNTDLTSMGWVREENDMLTRFRNYQL